MCSSDASARLLSAGPRFYLDHTGLVRQRSIGDLMRYSSLVQDVFAFDRHGDAAPAKVAPTRAMRYGDTQLYALAGS